MGRGGKRASSRRFLLKPRHEKRGLRETCPKKGPEKERTFKEKGVENRNSGTRMRMVKNKNGAQKERKTQKKTIDGK